MKTLSSAASWISSVNCNVDIFSINFPVNKIVQDIVNKSSSLFSSTDSSRYCLVNRSSSLLSFIISSLSVVVSSIICRRQRRLPCDIVVRIVNICVFDVVSAEHFITSIVVSSRWSSNYVLHRNHHDRVFNAIIKVIILLVHHHYLCCFRDYCHHWRCIFDVYIEVMITDPILQPNYVEFRKMKMGGRISDVNGEWRLGDCLKCIPYVAKIPRSASTRDWDFL